MLALDVTTWLRKWGTIVMVLAIGLLLESAILPARLIQLLLQ